MAKSLKDFVTEARSRIRIAPPSEAQDGDLILDVREPGELEKSGRIAGALNIPRGMIENRADPELSSANAQLTALRGNGTIYTLCGSGGRAALAADTLVQMGYDAVQIDGGLKGWKSAGLPVED